MVLVFTENFSQSAERTAMSGGKKGQGWFASLFAGSNKPRVDVAPFVAQLIEKYGVISVQSRKEAEVEACSAMRASIVAMAAEVRQLSASAPSPHP